jgi:hypothetical protein
MKHLSGIGKRCLLDSNLGYDYVDGIIAVSEVLDIFKLGATASGERMIL